MSFNPRNILVINFGQLGDVVMSLPALRAIRERFPHARITIAVGKPGKALVELSGSADEVMAVDRVALRDGAKALSLWRIGNLVRDVRGRGFDFVIDLHSLSETNILGFLSGATQRLYARRPGRSLDFLSNFRPRPPLEINSERKHLIDRYLAALTPLGIKDAPRLPRLVLPPDAVEFAEKLLIKGKAQTGAPLVGLFPGAGHPTRRWALTRFAELAAMLTGDGLRVVIVLGPEERELASEIKKTFPRGTLLFDRLTIPQLAAMLQHLSVFVTNDTGPMHIAAAVGTAVVVPLNYPQPSGYAPFGEHRLIYSHGIDEITVEQVYGATRELLARERTSAIFSA